MKRRSWTHAVRYSRHRLRLELRSLPSCMDPGWSRWHDQQAQQINIALCRNAVELLGMYADCGDMTEAERNIKWQRLRLRLKEAVAETAQRRELAKLRTLPAYKSADMLGKALMAIKAGFGGMPASEACGMTAHELERRIDRIARWAIGLQLFSVACWLAVLVLEFWP
jgi:hypothetical protein